MLQIFFVEDDFLGREEDAVPQVPVVVSKNLRIATPVTLEVVPLLMGEATLPPSIAVPPNNIYSPPYASKINVANTIYSFVTLSS